MPRKSLSFASWLLIFAVLAILIFLGYQHSAFLWEEGAQFYRFFSDKEAVTRFVNSFGKGTAPIVLMVIQFLQVLFAPIPGEATGGFIGGYLFGAGWGFLYSSVGLTAGSLLAFIIGRYLGQRYVRKLVPANQLTRLDALVRHQGIFVIFLLIATPGFPKDYLCLFLGLSTMPLKVFILIVTIGRIPGTLFWSLQGAFLFEHNYRLVAILFALCAGVTLLAYRYRKPLYQWVERIGGNSKQ
ncbi:MAG: VTT domain-containing protein [Desulfobacterales bacterium]